MTFWQPKEDSLQTELDAKKMEYLWRKSQVVVPTVPPPPQPIMFQTPQTEVRPQWWEQPKVLGEKGMEITGKVISKIPILPEALEFISPVFEFVHEKLEKPFAAIITSPFSPTLPWRIGENWIEHEKREYEAWKAPTYIKGAAEFAMPLWWIPWLGWAGKGAKALGVGNKIARATEAMVGKKGFLLDLPTKQMLNQTLYKEDFFRKAALWAENKPFLHGVVQAIGGRSAFVRDIGEVYPAMDLATRKLIAVTPENAIIPLTDVVKRELVNRAVIYDMRKGYSKLQFARLQQYGNPEIVLKVDEFGRVGAATPNAGNKLGTGLSEVFEHPELYTYATKEAEAIAHEGYKLLKEIWDLAAKEDVKVPKQPIFHRLVKGIEKIEGDKTVYEASEYGSRFEAQRHYKTMQEAIEAATKQGKKIVYDTDPLRSFGSTIDHVFKQISAKRFDDEIGKFGFSLQEYIARIEPTLMENIAEWATKAGSASYVIQTLKRLTGYGGKHIPGATMSKIKRGLPEVAERIEQAFSVSPKDIDSILSAMGQDFIRATKMKPLPLKIMLSQYVHLPDVKTIINLVNKGSFEDALSFLTRGGSSRNDAIKFINLVRSGAGTYEEAVNAFKSMATKIRVSDIEDFVRSLNLSDAISTKAISNAYRAVYKSRKDFIDETLKVATQEADTVLSQSRRELVPLKNQYREIVRELREGRQILGTGLAQFQKHSAFRNKIFDADVVRIVEKVESARASEWLRNVANISGVGRTFVAALDFSAPFIQGLLILAANPVAWIKGVGKQFQFFAKPQSLYKYFADPSVRLTMAERWHYGASLSTFDYFEALAPFQQVAGKIPKIGGGIKKAIGETYGRAEAAFTGFGEVARNEMWKALYRPNMTDIQLRELARSIDRMTGVMSTEALLIGRNQNEFENAFMFFAPRYTRAGMALATDILKGGMTGAQARTALGSLMASGMAMYYGISTVLGQQPVLDPRSAKFLTVEIGGSRVGIGGIFYALTRFGANVAATAATEPGLLNPLNLSRFDNPFYNFMFSRTSPLTSLGVNAILEQKNYFGEPIESIEDWGRFMAEKVLPIASQRVILEPEHRHPVLFASEIMGGRTFPKSPYELQEEARDAVAQREFNAVYDDLDKLQRRKVNKFPEVTQFQEDIDKITTFRGKALSKAQLAWRRELEDAREMHKSQAEQLQRAYDVGAITGYDFKEQVRLADYGYGKTYEHINSRPEYQEVLKELQDPKKKKDKETVWETAYEELMGYLNSPQAVDQYGLFDFDAYDKFVVHLTTKYGEPAMKQADAMRKEKYAEYPPLFQELLKAKEVLKPYWAVRDKVEKLFGKVYAESTWGQRMITEERQRIRAMNPELEKFYQMFYVQT